MWANKMNREEKRSPGAAGAQSSDYGKKSFIVRINQKGQQAGIDSCKAICAIAADDKEQARARAMERYHLEDSGEYEVFVV